MSRVFISTASRGMKTSSVLARHSLNNGVRFSRGFSRSSTKNTSSSLINHQFWMGAALGLTISGFSLYNTVKNDTEEKETKLDIKDDVNVEKTETKAEQKQESVKENDEKPENPDAPAEEASAEDYEGAAYNPVTGEINWDCPCLGGMAHGPCGEEFKEAFACFVYSETEPKGIDCIKKFEAMRTCFRRYPEHYKEQLMDEEELDRELNERREAEAGEAKPDASEGAAEAPAKKEAPKESEAPKEKAPKEAPKQAESSKEPESEPESKPETQA